MITGAQRLIPTLFTSSHKHVQTTDRQSFLKNIVMYKQFFFLIMQSRYSSLFLVLTMTMTSHNYVKQCQLSTKFTCPFSVQIT